MRHFCNPVNVPYHYQYLKGPGSEAPAVFREAADPAVIFYQGKYWLFASMNLSVWVSENLADWESCPLPGELPLYGYAPDACVVDGRVCITACDVAGENGVIFRTEDILNGPCERIEMPFSYKDPAMFQDEDGRVYFYWGCSADVPIQGVELDRRTLQPLGEPVPLIRCDAARFGFERVGEDNSTLPFTDAEVEERLRDLLAARGQRVEELPSFLLEIVRAQLKNAPYTEGAWMTKHGGVYYLQYAFSGTQYNVYGDGVYCAPSPLGPFSPAKNAPYSYAPGSFLPGAGHGSTFQDIYGNWWHAATMRISLSHNFERRVGIWPAGFDAGGELFCNQRYQDWPRLLPEGPADPWRDPDWMLLSAGKAVSASSYAEGHEPGCAAEENVRTFWKAASADAGQWIEMDLGREMEVHAVQLNFADDRLQMLPGEESYEMVADRYISPELQTLSWKLEGAGENGGFRVLADKSDAGTNLPHDLLVWESGRRLRRLRLTIYKMPYGESPCISGLRVFGRAEGALPGKPVFHAFRTGDLDMEVSIDEDGAVGHNILWGHAPDRLYHSRLVYGLQQRIGALIRGRDCYVRVDAFNEAGITEGEVVHVGGAPV